jgi:hypothetical protein
MHRAYNAQRRVDVVMKTVFHEGNTIHEVRGMNTVATLSFPRLSNLPPSIPPDGLIRIEIQEGVPVFRASTYVQKRIDLLLRKQRESDLTKDERDEIERYEEIDDYLSYVNRVVRNQLQQLSPKEP